jgi:dihydroneopterin aldolase/2-amino-4-hydroxy-6-hydroxymethyldihydropteridine diphosphokinase
MTHPLDEIRIRGLDVFACHGVFPEENKLGQHFIVNADLRLSVRRAGREDDLDQSVHYGEVCQCIDRELREHTWKLLEAAAEHTARQVLLDFPLLQELELELCKPSAPIPLPFETVSVKICRGWHRVYLGIGSNLGDREALLNGALDALEAREDVRNLRCSTLIETEPYGGVEQDSFLNGAVELDTLLTPEELLKVLHQLEQEAGRVRTIRWGPRTLDLDILLYDQEVVCTPDLMIPHADMLNRSFVLGPLAELAPYAVHPLRHQTIQELLWALEERGEC